MKQEHLMVLLAVGVFLLAQFTTQKAMAIDSSGFPGAAGTNAPIQVVSPLFSQLLVHMYPAGFSTPVERTIRSGEYVREAVLEGETLHDWSQVITVTASEGFALDLNITPQSVMGSFAAKFKKGCPASYSSLNNISKEPVLDGYDSLVAVLSCGESAPTGGKMSETTLIVVIAGYKDYYTLQWAERGAPSNTPIKIDKAKWQNRLSQLEPIKLCAIVPGEKSPYKSCLGAQ